MVCSLTFKDTAGNYWFSLSDARILSLVISLEGKVIVLTSFQERRELLITTRKRRRPKQNAYVLNQYSSGLGTFEAK